MPESNGSLPRTSAEWNRLRADFEREASAYHDLRLSIYPLIRGADPDPAFKQYQKLKHHAIILWSYCGKTQEAVPKPEDKTADDIQVTAVAVIEGSALELFLRMANRAGSLISESVRNTLQNQVLESVSQAFDEGEPGKPVMAWNSNALAIWLTFVFMSLVADQPTRYQVPTLPVDPFAASLAPFDLVSLRQVVPSLPPAPPSGAPANDTAVGTSRGKMLTVTEAAALLLDVVSGLDISRAKARVSKAASSQKFQTNGKKGEARRIDRDSFSTWLLDQRSRDLDAADE